MRWPAYPKYKDSGVDWLGEIPEDWKVNRLKFLCTIQTGDKDTVDALDDGQYPFFVRSQQIEKIDSFSYDGEAVLTAGDGVGVGKVYHYFVGKFDFHQRVYMMCNFQDITGKFFYFYLMSMFHKVALEGGAKSTVDSLRMPLFLNFQLTIPSKSEQELIVEFCEHSSMRIDALIAEQEKLFTLLQEKRQTVISHAVTKGLNPDAPMKDSGVEWLGSVPKHWRILPLKRCLREPLKYGANEAAELLDPNLPRYIRITDLRDDGTLNPDTFRSLPYEIAESYLLADGDVLLARSGATVGKSFIFRERMGCAAYAGYLIKASTTKLLVPDFLYLFSQSFGYWQWVNSIFIKSTIQNISAEKYDSLVLPVPPRAEQVQIVKFIERTEKDIDSLMEITSNSMALLRERRTALISAAVTGKIDVRGLTASESA